MHIVRLLNTILDLVKYWYFGWTFYQPFLDGKMVDGKFNQNTSVLLSLKSYLVTLQYASASSNLRKLFLTCSRFCDNQREFITWFSRCYKK